MAFIDDEYCDEVDLDELKVIANFESVIFSANLKPIV